MADTTLDIAGKGIQTAEEQMSALVNRMSNAETPGFKGSDVLVKSFKLELEAAENKLSTQKPEVVGSVYNFSQGSLIPTNKPTDLAIGGKGFFVIQGTWGEGYSRDGRFYVNNRGELVTVAGHYRVVGERGPISIESGKDFSVTETGEIRVDGAFVDRLRVVDFDDKTKLQSLNGVIFKAGEEALEQKDVESPRIVQGFVESSNSNAVSEMVELVSLSRMYSTVAKLVSTRDGVMSQTISIGRPQ